MNTVSLDTIKARTLLWEIINQPEFGPDHVYERPSGASTCYNWTGPDEDDKCHPSCLIGHLWFRLGFNEHQVPQLSGAEYVIRALGSDLLFPSGDPIREYLDAIQGAQDQRVAWGKAMHGGEKRLVGLLGLADRSFPASLNRDAVRAAAEHAWDLT